MHRGTIVHKSFVSRGDIYIYIKDGTEQGPEWGAGDGCEPDALNSPGKNKRPLCWWWCTSDNTAWHLATYLWRASLSMDQIPRMPQGAGKRSALVFSFQPLNKSGPSSSYRLGIKRGHVRKVVSIETNQPSVLYCRSTHEYSPPTFPRVHLHYVASKIFTDKPYIHLLTFKLYCILTGLVKK